ncbi:MAG: formate dehydrogenase subunit gamma [Acidobacteriota bacterium]
MSARLEMIRRFSRRHIVNHLVMLVCFLGLVLTGLPQKFPDQAWAKGVVLIIGGLPRVRFLHHLLGTLMAFQLVWHGLEALWLHFARRLSMPMIPRLDDVRQFMQQIRFNLGLASAPPSMDRYTFAEKLEYLALVWGTAVMVATGVILLYPVRWTGLFPGEVILAAKAAHGGEAILAFLSILTWHVYFVHVRHWNKAIFTGTLDEEAYAEEHAIELDRIRNGEVDVPAPIRRWRAVVFAAVTLLVVAATVAFVWWLRAVPTVVSKVSPW